MSAFQFWNIAIMKYEILISRRVRAMLLALAALLFGSAGAFAGGTLQGQDKGNTNTWSSVNLLNWQELDFIPFRVAFTSGSGGNQTINLDFTHLSGNGVPGFEDLYNFTAFTPNVSIVSGPTLTMDPSGTWHYSLTVNISDSNPAEVRFSARVAAGSHLNGGSSLHLKSNFGNVQMHKIDAGPNIPDLAITKTAPVTIAQDGTITYTTPET